MRPQWQRLARTGKLHGLFVLSPGPLRPTEPEPSRFEEVLASQIGQRVASSRIASQMPLLESQIRTWNFERLRADASADPEG